MVVNKRKKNSRQRGSWTHGWGEKKKHRHAGSRGGRGMAGTGKRADQNKPSIAADHKYFGKFGFKRKGLHVIINPINIDTLQSNLATLIADKVAVKKDAGYAIDLTKTKYNKLLANGVASMPLFVTVAYASAGAIAKVKEAKGDVTVTVEKKEKKVKAPKKA